MSENLLDYQQQRKVLFICKTRGGYGTDYPQQYTSGLALSASTAVQMLTERHISAGIAIANDANDINRLVTQARPTICIIEAIWVQPAKLVELHQRHPSIVWVVRLHSELPFLAMEGAAIEAIHEYAKLPYVLIGCNSDRLFSDLTNIMCCTRQLLHLPNWYPLGPFRPKPHAAHVGRVAIGCFGAVRPLKNHLTQAVAAISLGNSENLPIDFHINAPRVEQGADNVLKNLEALFVNSNGHRLVKHDWLHYKDFKALVRQMDMGMQVSLSETFNFVAADFVAQAVPVVGSTEIRWLPTNYRADMHSTSAIANTLATLWATRYVAPEAGYRAIARYNGNAAEVWMRALDRADLQH